MQLHWEGMGREALGSVYTAETKDTCVRGRQVLEGHLVRLVL